MIGKKEMALIGMGKKIVKRHKKNFSRFMNNDFYVRIFLVDEKGSDLKKVVEYTINSNDWMDYIEMADFGNYKVDKIEFSASGR